MAPKNELAIPNDLVFPIITVTTEPVNLDAYKRPKVELESVPENAIPSRPLNTEKYAGIPQAHLVPTAFRNDLPRFGIGDTPAEAPIEPVSGALVEWALANPEKAADAVGSVITSLRLFASGLSEHSGTSASQEDIRAEILSQLQSSGLRMSDRFWMDQRGTALLHFDAGTGALIPGARIPDGASVFSVTVRMDGTNNRIEFEPGTRGNLESLVDEGMPPSLLRTVQSLIALEGQPIVEQNGAPLPQLGSGADFEIVAKPAPERLDEISRQIAKLRSTQVTMLFGGYFQSYALSTQLRQGTIYLDPKGNVMGGSLGMPDYASPRGRMREGGLLLGTPVNVILGASHQLGIDQFGLLYAGADDLNPEQRAVLDGLLDRFAPQREAMLADNPYLLDPVLAGFGRPEHAASDFSRSFAAVLDELTHRRGHSDFHGTLEVAWSPDSASYFVVDPANPYQSHYERAGAIRVDFDAQTKALSASLEPGSRLEPNAAEGIGRFLDWFTGRTRQPFLLR